MVVSTFHLRVQRIEACCLFELSWGQGRRLTATVECDSDLSESYHVWQRLYLSFYTTAMPKVAPAQANASVPLRGWNIDGGELTPAHVDWHARLLEAETKLLQAFYRWLRNAELFEMRAAIAEASQHLGASPTGQGQPGITVFLSCAPLELARLPWEAWEIGSDFVTTGPIRLVRSPSTIRTDSVAPQNQRRRVRVLAILGDDTGLNFRADSEAIRSLSPMSEVVFVGWQPGQTVVEVKEQISRAIADPRGWDILFFAGHSNETLVTGGELAVAPGMSMSIHDITAQLNRARTLGLQVAIFNSCKGMSIAESLISLGFSQVVVMREPVHNRVAQEFLVQFLRQLASHKDIHESVLSACQVLRFEKGLTYPSAYLLPSLFCHPEAAIFRIEPVGWGKVLQQWLPSRVEAIALTAAVMLSLIPALQATLLNSRVGLQSLYREWTHQMPVSESPPITLVQIDTSSINRDGIAQLHPIDREYLARLIQRVQEMDASLVGLDVVLDTPQPGDIALGQAVQQAVDKDQVWFVFAALLDLNGEIGVNDATQIASPHWSMQGYIDADPYHVMLPLVGDDCRRACPFAYVLALTHAAHHELSATAFPQLQIDLSSPEDTRDLRTQLLASIHPQRSNSPLVEDIWRSRLPWISYWAYEWLGQFWLEPIIDFSIPPDQVFHRISAWQLLDDTESLDLNLSQQVVLIAAGSDERTAIAPGSPDRVPAPLALRYWENQHWLSGGESLAYMTHHLITQRLVVPIPNLWMIGLAALAGKVVVVWLQHQRDCHYRLSYHIWHYRITLVFITLLYGWLGLQLFISAEIVLPWLLPSLLLWSYILPMLRSPHTR